MRVLYGAILALIVLAAGGVAYVYSGMYNIAASDDHSTVGSWITHTTMHRSVETSADSIDVPNLDDGGMIKRGARAYDAICATCHLKPGLEDTVLRAGLNPMPPTLMEPGHWAPAEQFWIVKHGIKMTGMPAWGETHGDDELWEVVAFLQRLPTLSEQEYSVLASAKGPAAEPSHGDGHDHSHGDMSAMMGSSDSPAASNAQENSQPTPTLPEDGGNNQGGHYADGHSH